MTSHRVATAGLVEGKIALVTGAASGIGRETATALAREGARVALVDRDGDRAEAAAMDLREAGYHVVAIAADVTAEDQVAAMIERTRAEFGGLDIAVNNAGIGPSSVGERGRKIHEISGSAWHQIIGVNLTGLWHCLKYELMVMPQGAAIVNVSSIGGVVALPGSGAYAAAKHGVVGLTKVAAAEYGPAGIRVNAICPGYVQTPLTEANLAERGAMLSAKTPLGRTARVAEIADAIVWLSSDRSSFTTGAIMLVDGGYTAV